MTITATTIKLTPRAEHAITFAGSNGHLAVGGVPARDMVKFARRLADVGLVVFAWNEQAAEKYGQSAGIDGGIWLTESGWLVRRELRAAVGQPADEIVEWVLSGADRPAGAVKLTYSDAVPPELYYNEAN